MESILLIFLISLIGGIDVGIQSPLASMLTQRLGIFESVFIVHIGDAPRDRPAINHRAIG